MNSGTAEHEQNGVTMPKPAAATVPTAALPAGEGATARAPGTRTSA